MLTKHITLYVIDRIFTIEAKKILNAHAKMVYINCLSNHFKNLDAYISNLGDFFVDTSNIPVFDTFKPLFDELFDAGLIEISEGGYIFKNKWSAHMNLSALPKEKPHSRITLQEWHTRLSGSEEFIEICGMKNRISLSEVRTLLQLFITEQKALSMEYANEVECKKHFMNWIPFNVDKQKKKTVVSKGQILGKND